MARFCTGRVGLKAEGALIGKGDLRWQALLGRLDARYRKTVIPDAKAAMPSRPTKMVSRRLTYSGAAGNLCGSVFAAPTTIMNTATTLMSATGPTS